MSLSFADLGTFGVLLAAYDITPGGGGGGGVTLVTGTTNQIIVNNTNPAIPIIGIASNPIIPGNTTSASFNASGLGNVTGTGTIQVFNGAEVVLGTETTFLTDLGTDAAIIIDSVGYTVLEIISDTTLVLSSNYTGDDASGLAYTIDAPFFTMTSNQGVHIGQFKNSGTLVYDTPFTSFRPSLIPYSPDGSSSKFDITADSLNFIIDVAGNFTVNSGTDIMIQITSPGNVLMFGDLTVGSGAGAGQNIFMPTSGFNTYSPSANSSNFGGPPFSLWTFNSDNFLFNIDSSQSFVIEGSGSNIFNVIGDGTVFTTNNLLDDPLGNMFCQGNIQIDNTVEQDYKILLSGIALDGSADSGGAALCLTHNGPTNRQFAFAPSEFMSPSSDVGMIRFILGSDEPEIDALSTDLSTDLPLYFNFQQAPVYVGGNLTSNRTGGSNSWITLQSTGGGLAQIDWADGNAQITFDSTSSNAFQFSNNIEGAGDIQADGNIIAGNVAPLEIMLTNDGSNPQIQFGSSSSNTLTYDGSFNFSKGVQVGTVSCRGNALINTNDMAVTHAFSVFDSLGNYGFNIDTSLDILSSIFAVNSMGTDDTTYKYLLSGMALDGSTDTGGAALVLIHNSTGNRQFGLVASDSLLAPPDATHPIARWVMGTTGIDFSVISTDGSTNLPLIFQSGFGPAEFFGFLSIGQNLPSYKVDIQDSDAALRLDANSGTPATPSSGVAFFSNFDSGLGHSLAFYVDDAGNVTQIGEGSGGGGTVTEVTVSSDLTVDGTAGGSFTVNGTIGLPDLVTADTYQFSQIAINSKGIATSISSLGSWDNVNGNLILNGNGTSSHTGLVQCLIIGQDADVSDDSTTSGIAIGNGALAGTESVSLGLNSGSSTNSHTGAFFLGTNSDATTNGLFNITAIGYEARVGADDTIVLGRPSTSTVVGGPTANSTLHVISGTTSGTNGEDGVLRLNGINDADNNWPVSDIVTLQNAIVQDGAVTDTILIIPISSGLGGCNTFAKIVVQGIVGNNGPGISSISGTLEVAGAYDGSPGNFYINGVSTTTPVSITLNQGTTDTTTLLAAATVSLTGTSGPGTQSLIVQVTGVNANFINWIAYATYSTVQSTSNT